MPNTKKDPTQTTTVRKRMASTLRGGLLSFVRDFRRLVRDQDPLRLRGPVGIQTTSISQFASEVENAFASNFGGDRRNRIVDIATRAYTRGLINAHRQASGIDAVRNMDAQLENQRAFISQMMRRADTQQEIALLISRIEEAVNGIGSKARTDIARIASDAVQESKSQSQFIKESAEAVSKLSHRLDKTAETEITRMHAEAQLTAFAAMGLKNVGVMAEWVTMGDDRVCPECAAMEGRLFPIEEARGMIPLHVNCVLPESIVEFTDALALTRCKYRGPVVRISTKFGRRISVTQNHILMTQRGWVRAIDLNQTDQLVDTSSFDGNFLGDPHNQKGIPNIRAVFESFSEMVGESQRIVTRAAPEDFHTDGSFVDSEIDIVVSDSKFGSVGDSSLIKELRKFEFVGGSSRHIMPGSLSPFSSQYLYLHRHFTSPYSFVGRDGVLDVFLCGSCGHHFTVGLGVSSWGDSTGNQSEINGDPRQSHHFGDMIDRLPFSVEFDNIVNIDVSFAETDVFDVFSHSLSYSLEGIVSSNCRCLYVISDKKRLRNSKRHDKVHNHGHTIRRGSHKCCSC